MSAGEPQPPLYLPEVPFPPYRFVPGETPHPYKQAGGYAFGEHRAPPPYLPADDWRANRAFLRGVDFFNRGWWWEAHEEWEALWKVCRERDPDQFDLLQSLIQIAAAALNLERGHDAAAERLRERAAERLDGLAARAPRLCGLAPASLARLAREALPPGDGAPPLRLHPGAAPG